MSAIDPKTKEHDDVVLFIKEQQEKRFEVLCNISTDEQHYIDGFIPDLIIKEKGSDNVLFVIEVKRNGLVHDCILSWKQLVSRYYTLYIIVPSAELQHAKILATSAGLDIRFGTYEYDPSLNKVLQITYDA